MYETMIWEHAFPKVRYPHPWDIADLISKGNRFIIEPMEYAKLAKKEQETIKQNDLENRRREEVYGILKGNR